MLRRWAFICAEKGGIMFWKRMLVVVWLLGFTVIIPANSIATPSTSERRPTAGTQIELGDIFPTKGTKLAWYTNTVNNSTEGMYYRWLTGTKFELWHQYGEPTPLQWKLRDNFEWNKNKTPAGFYYYGSEDTYGARKGVIYNDGILYVPRYWEDGSHPTYQGTSSYYAWDDGIQPYPWEERGTAAWSLYVYGWDEVATNVMALRVELTQINTPVGGQPGKPYKEIWWLGEHEGNVGIIRSRGDTNNDGTAEWDVWHTWPFFYDIPYGNPNATVTPGLASSMTPTPLRTPMATTLNGVTPTATQRLNKEPYDFFLPLTQH